MSDEAVVISDQKLSMIIRDYEFSPMMYSSRDAQSVLRALRELQSLRSRAEADGRDAARYRFWRQRQYCGMLDVDEFCDESSPQAVHFDRLTDEYMSHADKETV